MALTQNQNEIINVVKLCCQFSAFVNILQFMFCRNRNLAFYLLWSQSFEWEVPVSTNQVSPFLYAFSQYKERLE